MANGSGTAIFYKEVIEAIRRDPPDVGDLHVLRDLCIAVDASNKSAVSKPLEDLLKLSGFEDPLHSISYELFHALLARMLLKGWFDDFDRLIAWPQSLFGTQDERVADLWDGIVKVVKADLQPFGRSRMFVPHLLTLLNREEDWKRALNGLKGAYRHLAKVRLPPPTLMGDPPIPPAYYERVLPEQLTEAIEEFFRLLQMLFQHTLELAIARLEQDNNDVQALWKLADLQLTLRAELATQQAMLRHESRHERESRGLHGSPLTMQKYIQGERERRGLNRRIRVAEVRYGRGRPKVHRFLDSFPRYDARSVVFNSLDREDKDEPYIRGELPPSILRARDLQLQFYFDAYGHPQDPKGASSAWHTRRRALIKSKHAGQLKLRDDDDFVAFLANYFDDELADVMRRDRSLTKGEAAVSAWLTAVNPWGLYAARFTSHSRLNLTEGPPNYLTHAFPRNIAGRLFHDCGVYAVRAAYTLLSLLERINRAHPGIAGTVRARWVRLPLHVGVFIESDLGVVLQHNQHLDVIDKDGVDEVWEEWDKKEPPSDPDPPEVDKVLLRFHEDLATSAFSSDLDMPVSSTPLLEPGEPVTTKTIWNSYQKKVVPSQLFSPLVGAPNAPQYQFDTRYLKLSELEREWYNEYVLKFWNVGCNKVWTKWKNILTKAETNKDPEKLKKHKQAYTDALDEAIKTLLDSYDAEIKPKKKQLSSDLHANKAKVLLKDIRIVASERIGTVLSPVRKVKDHIKDVSDPDSTFPPDFVPTFAKPEEELLEMP